MKFRVHMLLSFFVLVVKNNSCCHKGYLTMKIDELWNRIIELEGEEFYTATGLKFTYVVVDDHQIQPHRDGKIRWKLSKKPFC